MELIRVWMCRVRPSVLPIRLWEPLTHCTTYTGWYRNASSCTKTSMLPQNEISVCLISECGHRKTRVLVSSAAPTQYVCNLQHIMPQAQIGKFRLWGNAWRLPAADVHAMIIKNMTNSTWTPWHIWIWTTRNLSSSLLLSHHKPLHIPWTSCNGRLQDSSHLILRHVVNCSH